MLKLESRGMLEITVSTFEGLRKTTNSVLG